MHERFIRACPLGFSNSPGSGQFKIFNSLYSTLWKVYSEYTLFNGDCPLGFHAHVHTRVLDSPGSALRFYSKISNGHSYGEWWVTRGESRPGSQGIFLNKTAERSPGILYTRVSETQWTLPIGKVCILNTLFAPRGIWKTQWTSSYICARACGTVWGKKFYVK